MYDDDAIMMEQLARRVLITVTSSEYCESVRQQKDDRYMEYSPPSTCVILSFCGNSGNRCSRKGGGASPIKE